MARKPKREQPDKELEARAEELRRLREFVDETSFGDDQRDLTGELSVVDQHPADTADFLYERELDETTRQILDQETLQVQDAMERRREGKYGICAECGKPIGKERLRARPEATLCIDCQRRRDGSERLAS
ncbi:MAG: hypothetical protein QOF51_4023 [Chloroflexota bacterium]|nr:hypothetical protein [Chloroflexota bacterium]